MSFRLAAAQKDLKEAIEPFLSMASLSPPGNLNFLHFNIFGMRHSTQIQLYERRDKEGPVLILRSSHGSGNDKGKECLIDATALSDLETLLEKYRLKEWDGFKGTSQPDVLDGESFYLKVGFRDASGIYATGENSFPEGFHAFQNALKTFVKKQFNDEE